VDAGGEKLRFFFLNKFALPGAISTGAKNLKGGKHMLYLANAFSIGMLDSANAIIKVSEAEVEKIRSLMKNNFTSAVGHQSTSEILSKLLNVTVPMNRSPIKIKEGDTLVIFQLLTRLEEGRVLTADEILSLPYKFYIVEVLPYNETIEALYHW